MPRPPTSCVALAELLDIPVMTTTDGKSAFPEDHALALGSGGVVYTGHGRHFLLDSDVIFAIGTSLTRHNISTPIIPPGKKIIHATNDARDLYKANDTAIPILGDAKLVLGAACRGGEGPARRQNARDRRAAAHRRSEAGVARALGGKAALDRDGRSTRIS